MFTNITINFYHLLLLVAAIQGFILTFLLLFKKQSASRPNQFLALLLFTFSLHLLHQIGFISGLFNLFPKLHIFPFSYLFIIGPAVFFYARALANPTFRPVWKTWLHFLPSFYLVPALIFYFTVLKGADKQYKMMFFSAINFIENYLSVAVIFVYFLLGLKVIRKYRALQYGDGANHLRTNLNWLYSLIMTLFAGLFIWTSYFFYQHNFIGAKLNLESYYPFYLSLAVLIYWIGFIGYFRAGVDLNSFRTFKAPVFAFQGAELSASFMFSQNQELEELLDETEQQKEEKSQIGQSEEDRQIVFARLGLDEDSARMVMGKIKRKLESEKLFLRHHLSLNDFAKEIDCSPRTVSVVINQLCGENFSDFINAYRIQEVMRLLKDRSKRNYTLHGIASEAGFNSKTTFNRVFKEFTGYTPKQYRSVSWHME